MQKELIKNSSVNYALIIKTALLELLVTGVIMLLFSALMYFCDIGFEYSLLFSTLSVAVGLFIASYYMAYKRRDKGMLTGFICGVITFMIILIISLIIDDGGITYNTLFHLIIFLLSALIGGVLGVNKAINKKYI